MNKMIAGTSLLIILLSPIAKGDVIDIAFNGVEFGMTVEAVTQRLEARCKELQRHESSKPVIPVAREQESYLVCKGFQSTGARRFGRAAFTFGDDALAMVEIREGVSALSALAKSESRNFLHFQAHFHEMLIIDPHSDAAWLLTMDSLHPHMFLWENPSLSDGSFTVQTFDDSAAIPAELKFGASIETVAPLLEQACALTEIDEIDRI